MLKGSQFGDPLTIPALSTAEVFTLSKAVSVSTVTLVSGRQRTLNARTAPAWWRQSVRSPANSVEFFTRKRPSGPAPSSLSTCNWSLEIMSL